MCVNCVGGQMYILFFFAQMFSRHIRMQMLQHLYIEICSNWLSWQINLQFEFNCKCKQKCETIIYSNVCYLVC